MNSIPSMDRHIQQTNDRLQCIKQVRRGGATICHKSSRYLEKRKKRHVMMFPLGLGGRGLILDTQSWPPDIRLSAESLICWVLLSRLFLRLLTEVKERRPSSLPHHHPSVHAVTSAHPR